MKLAAPIFCVCVLAAAAQAQDDASPQVNPEAVLPASAADAPPAPSSVLHDLFGPGVFGETFAAAVSDQIRRFPAEWGHGATHGFGARSGSEYGQVAIGNLIQSGVQAWHREDPRYFRRGAGNFFVRTFHVIENTLVVHSTEGGRTVSLALPASAYGSWAIAARWYPDYLRGAGSFFHYGSLNVGMKAAGNFFREFWPDVKSIFRAR